MQRGTFFSFSKQRLLLKSLNDSKENENNTTPDGSCFLDSFGSQGIAVIRHHNRCGFIPPASVVCIEFFVFRLPGRASAHKHWICYADKRHQFTDVSTFIQTLMLKLLFLKPQLRRARLALTLVLNCSKSYAHNLDRNSPHLVLIKGFAMQGRQAFAVAEGHNALPGRVFDHRRCQAAIFEMGKVAMSLGTVQHSHNRSAKLNVVYAERPMVGREETTKSTSWIVTQNPKCRNE